MLSTKLNVLHFFLYSNDYSTEIFILVLHKKRDYFKSIIIQISNDNLKLIHKCLECLPLHNLPGHCKNFNIKNFLYRFDKQTKKKCLKKKL